MPFHAMMSRFQSDQYFPAKHGRMIEAVERMLDLNKKRDSEKNPETLRRLETQINATDRQIDRLVYELYGLSEEEIGIMEGMNNE